MRVRRNADMMRACSCSARKTSASVTRLTAATTYIGNSLIAVLQRRCPFNHRQQNTRPSALYSSALCFLLGHTLLIDLYVLIKPLPPAFVCTSLTALSNPPTSSLPTPLATT